MPLWVLHFPVCLVASIQWLDRPGHHQKLPCFDEQSPPPPPPPFPQGWGWHPGAPSSRTKRNVRSKAHHASFANPILLCSKQMPQEMLPLTCGWWCRTLRSHEIDSWTLHGDPRDVDEASVGEHAVMDEAVEPLDLNQGGFSTVQTCSTAEIMPSVSG